MKKNEPLYITPYIQKNKIKDPVLAEALKFELDRRVYHYGNHFKNSTENCYKRNKIKKLLRDLIFKSKTLLDSFKESNKDELRIVSGAYVSASSKIQGQNLKTIIPPWTPSLSTQHYFSTKLFDNCLKVQTILNECNYNKLFSEDFFEAFQEMRSELISFYSNDNVKGAIFPNDIGFFEIVSIRILKDLKKKSFLYLHGIPSGYYPGVFDKSDYLLVWGEKIKQHFSETGIEAGKIFVVGHPGPYKGSDQKLKNDLSNILVLGNVIPGAQATDDPILWDRGNVAYYCYLVQDVLKSLGVKSVTLRPHPSENISWYKKFIDTDFFKFDDSANLKEAILKSSLVIGSSSTSAIESLGFGVNHIVFEPFYGEDSYLKYKLVPPFDKSDARLVVATTSEELKECLEKSELCDPSIIKDYISGDYKLEETVKKLI